MSRGQGVIARSGATWQSPCIDGRDYFGHAPLQWHPSSDPFPSKSTASSGSNVNGRSADVTHARPVVRFSPTEKAAIGRPTKPNTFVSPDCATHRERRSYRINRWSGALLRWIKSASTGCSIPLVLSHTRLVRSCAPWLYY